MSLDVAIAHATTIKRYDLLIDIAADAVASLFHDLWLERAVAVARGENLKAPQRALNGFLGMAITPILFWLPCLSHVRVHLAIQSTLYEHLQKRCENAVTTHHGFTQTQLVGGLLGKIFKIKFLLFHLVSNLVIDTLYRADSSNPHKIALLSRNQFESTTPSSPLTPYPLPLTPYPLPLFRIFPTKLSPHV